MLDRTLTALADPTRRAILARLAQEAAARGTPIFCLDHPANEDLRVLGAVPLPRASAIGV